MHNEFTFLSSCLGTGLGFGILQYKVRPYKKSPLDFPALSYISYRWGQAPRENKDRCGAAKGAAHEIRGRLTWRKDTPTTKERST
ncbi:hypothetical protein GDO81_014800 [Engystomops pustulosus]|uniref:Uncharacterized protein n=1 Tax=Engystomops pustulosus TaxID=76066 RepID=A0AAV7AF12_ENGPU|nr:hypothetical protein GDO81_014800 [Engystomops pustulosus]